MHLNNLGHSLNNNNSFLQSICSAFSSKMDDVLYVFDSGVIKATTIRKIEAEVLAGYYLGMGASSTQEIHHQIRTTISNALSYDAVKALVDQLLLEFFLNESKNPLYVSIYNQKKPSDILKNYIGTIVSIEYVKDFLISMVIKQYEIEAKLIIDSSYLEKIGLSQEQKDILAIVYFFGGLSQSDKLSILSISPYLDSKLSTYFKLKSSEIIGVQIRKIFELLNINNI